MDINLTIAIPTYNRKIQLEKTLKMLDNQSVKRFYLVIGDNCSNYNVKDLLSGLSDDLLNRTEIYINSANIGSSGNICNLFLHGKTKWIWVVGDDDTIYNDAVEKIYSYIEKYSEASWIEFPVFDDMSLVPRDLTFSSLSELIDFFYNNSSKINVTAFGEIAFVGNKVFNFEKIQNAILTMYESNYVRMSTGLLMLKLTDMKKKGIIACTQIMHHGQDENIGNTWNNIKVCQGTRIFKDIPFDINKEYQKKLLSLVIPPDSEIFRGVRDGQFVRGRYWMLKCLYYEVYRDIAPIRRRFKFLLFMYFQKNEKRHNLFVKLYQMYKEMKGI